MCRLWRRGKIEYIERLAGAEVANLSIASRQWSPETPGPCVAGERDGYRLCHRATFSRCLARTAISGSGRAAR